MININDYLYSLPEDRIAKFPLAQRDQSALLIYKDGYIEHEIFKNIADHVPGGSLLVFNDTKVIPARLHFQKETGAVIEIFLLHPYEAMLLEAMQSKNQSIWQCVIGNQKRWSNGITLRKNVNGAVLSAKLLDVTTGLVEFSWDMPVSFAEIIHQSGETPLPPYLKREAVASDKERYQTIYSYHEGAVAAPTAGLHFTPDVLASLVANNIQTEFLTLHVSAGTFQPIKTEDALAHTMHSEQIVVQKQTLSNLISHTSMVIPVGTTSMRTLESLYWMGVHVIHKNPSPFLVAQTTPYETYEHLPTAKESLQALVDYLNQTGEDELIGHTSIYIHHGYDFKMCDALITNFHQPGSTLLLLIAAFVGSDWKSIYETALKNGYRFLSYGDSSLLWRNRQG